jgi:hypothetical protein
MQAGDGSVKAAADSAISRIAHRKGGRFKASDLARKFER